ncbi:WD40 repeat domain-containing protein [Aeoliella sp. SH292]|uniref:WD40 repeat domain-containing protein n=1 Tax=Aeoliella sp. SH292 TaxID=3454464 RepID=UPI003F947CE9
MLRVALVLLTAAVAVPLDAQQLTDERNIAETGEEYGSLAFDPSGNKFYTAGSGNLIKIRDTATGELLGTIDEQLSCYTWALAVSPDGETIAASHGSSGTDGVEISLFDTTTGELRTKLVGHDKVSRSLLFLQDSKTIVTSGDDNTLRWWDTVTGENLTTAKVGGHTFAATGDGGTIVIATDSNGVEIWDTNERALVRRLTLNPAATYPIALSSDGKWIATSGDWDDTAVYLWNAETGENVGKFDDERRDRVDCIAFSPDNRLVGVAELNSGVTLWDRGTGKRLSRTSGGIAHGLAFDPSGKCLAQVHGNSEGGSGVTLWSVGDPDFTN